MLWRLIILCLPFFSLVADVPDSIRRDYALKMHEAFIQQSVGLATQAFFTFKNAYQSALQAGESIQKVELIEQLFYWYRHYGSSLGLMANPSQIGDEYRGRSKKAMGLFSMEKSPLANIPNYQSEWGKDPQQAGEIRNFMLGVGEVIAGVFCISVGSMPIKTGGFTLLSDGVVRMWEAGNNAWTQHEQAAHALNQWEQNAKRVNSNH